MYCTLRNYVYQSPAMYGLKNISVILYDYEFIAIDPGYKRK